MTAAFSFTSSTVVAWLALAIPLGLVAVVLGPFVIADLLRRRRVRRRMDGLFSPVRAAPSGDAAGDGDFRLPVPCGRFAVGGGGLSARPAAPHSVFSVPASVVAVEPSVPRAGRARTANGPGHTTHLKEAEL